MLSKTLSKRDDSECQPVVNGIPGCKADYIWIASIIITTIFLLIGLERLVRCIQHRRARRIKAGQKGEELNALATDNDTTPPPSAVDTSDPWLHQTKSFDTSLLMEQGELKDIEKLDFAYIYRDALRSSPLLKSPNDKRLSIATVENSPGFGSPTLFSTPPRLATPRTPQRTPAAPVPLMMTPLDSCSPSPYVTVDPPSYPGSAIVSDKYSANLTP